MRHTNKRLGLANHVRACLICIASLIFCHESFSQNVAINTDGSKADPNAIVDIKSTSKGLLIPRMTTAQRMRVPQTNGLLVYDTNTKSFWFSNGVAWQNMSAADAPVTSSDAWLLTGNAGTNEAVNFIGTTDNRALAFRVNNQKAGRIDNSWGNTFFGLGSGTNNLPGLGQNNTGIGASALFMLTTGGSNTAVGSNALQSNTTGFDNSALGRMALLSNSTGYNNTAVGISALFSNTTGNTNSALGASTLYSNTTGNENTALGAKALYSNTTGNENIAIGNSALEGNTTNSGNVAIGYRTLTVNRQNNNTAIGWSALSVNGFGFFNTAVGATSLQSNTSGGLNTAVGFQSMQANIDGSNNTATGVFAMAANISGSVNTAFGVLALGHNTGGNENAAFGYQSLVSNTTGGGNTAVGTSAMTMNSTGFGNVAVGEAALYNNETGTLNTCIGTGTNVTNPNFTNSTALGHGALIDMSNKIRFGNGGVMVIEGNVPYSTPSDGRFKKQIKEDVKGLEFILQLRPVTYQFDGKKFDTEIQGKVARNDSTVSIQAANLQDSYDASNQVRRSGFIAQEVETAAAKSGYNFSGITKPKSEKEHYSLSYESFVVPLVKAVQEQQQIINEQNKKIELLMQEIQEIKKSISMAQNK